MVFETIRSLLAQCISCDEARIHRDTVILEDLECAPEDLAEVLMGIEEELGVPLSEDAVRRISTVDDLVRLVEEKMED